MNGPKAEHQVGARNSNNPSGRKKFLKHSKCLLVVRMVVGRDKDNGIGNIEISITSRQSLARLLDGLFDGLFDGIRHGQRKDVERLTCLIRHMLQPFEIILEWLIIYISWVVFDGTDDCGGIHEPGDVVYMPVRVVAHDTVSQPSDMGNAEIGPECILNI